MFVLSLNMFLLHLLLLYAFLHSVWLGFWCVLAETVDVNWEFIHGFGCRSRPC